ncbi:biotin/lipoyl-containing protein [Bacillus tuaregi]|uniref:biotin/lipoyl-containing protein n=1 Tax=Bacillus tuaregi TaxID=1816695 RepID=UPI0008F91E9E|nr:biotin/lipoyl-containing protein [Bacillus tuaregi]
MKEIKAIMAGTVLMISIQKGDRISAGQEVLVLESMKMAIPIESGEAGEVTNILVTVGDFVNEGDVLLTLS